MANKPITTAPTTMGKPRAPDGSPDSKGVPKNITFGTLPPRDPNDSGPTETTGSEAARSRPITFGEPHPPTAPKTEISRKERIATGIETPPKPHPKSQSFQQPERQPDTPPAGPPLTRAELVGAVETPVDARTVQQAEEERLAKQQRLTDEIDIEVAHRREAQRKQAEADKAKAEADVKARTNQLLHKK